MAQNSPLSTPISNVFCGSTRAKTNASKARSRRLHHTSSAVQQIKPAVGIGDVEYTSYKGATGKSLAAPFTCF